MTPEAIRIVGQLRSEFYQLFAATLEVPVTVTKGSSYSSNLPKVAWVDGLQRTNYICIYAHLAPDVFIPERPLILRLGINQGLEIETPTRLVRKAPHAQRKLQFCLTLLPREVLAFVPWVHNCFQAHGKALGELPTPPSLLNTQHWSELLLQGAWTRNAIACLQVQRIPAASESTSLQEATVDCAL